MHVPDAKTLRQVAWVFVKLGTIAFGGPAAHVAMMEDEVVTRRQWMTRKEFLDHLAAANLIPGPNSTELAIYIGRASAGWPGLLIAGLCFILPATLIVATLAAVYVRFGQLPEIDAFLYGIKPVVIAIVLQALWRLAHTAVKSPFLGLLAVVALAASSLGVHELVILTGCGLAGALWKLRGSGTSVRAVATIGLALTSPLTAAAGASVPFEFCRMFVLFVKAGALLFGSGYVLLTFLRADFVVRFGWLTEQQLLDAIVAGQITPGPVFTTATFVGYLLGGAPGAVVATAGIFLPAFVFVALSAPLLPRIRRSPLAGAVLDGVMVASLGLMAVVTWQLGRAALVDWLTAVIAVASGILLFRKVQQAWLLAGGAILGVLLGR